MKYYKIILYVFLLGMISVDLSAQDPHFSQFYASPLLLNPALTGTGDGRYRVASIYRDQWRSALENPFRTYNVAGDVNYEINARTNDNPDKFAVGLSFFGDRVNTFDFNTTSISLYGAYHKALDKKTRSFLSGGIYIGVGQKNINYEDLSFEDQFNSIDAYTLPSGEFLPTNNFGYADLGLGINYSISPSKGSYLYAGVGVFHLNSPNISFYKDDQSNNEELIRANQLDPKVSIHGGASLKTSEKWSIQPRVIALLQGEHREYSFGTNLRYIINDQSGTYFHMGPYLRMVDNIEGLDMEAAVLAIGLEKGSVIIGLSYDHNLGDLTGNRQGLGAFEISVSFTGEFNNADDYCPKF